MPYQRVRALVNVKHDGVLRIPGVTSGENAQDFVVSDVGAQRLIALGIVAYIESAPTPVDNLEQVWVDGRGIFRRSSGSALSAGIPGFCVTPASRDSDGLDVAISMCVAVGSGTVVLENARYAITRSHQLASGVNFVGTPLQWTFGLADQVPDFWTIPETGEGLGTIFDVAAGIDALVWNHIDLPAVQSPLMDHVLNQVHIYGVAFRGGRKAIRIGGTNAMGAIDGGIDMIHAYNQTCDDGGFAIDIQNTQFYKHGRVRVSNDQEFAIGGNYRFCCTLPQAVLLTGDSDIDHTFSRVTSRTRKGVVLEAENPLTALLNNVKIKRTHSSRYIESTPATVNVTTASGVADMVVANATQFQLCQLGMPLRWQTTAPTGFDAAVTYFVVARNAGASTIQLAEAEYSAAITPTSGAAFAMYCGGFPTFIARAGTNSAVKNCDFGNLALEVTGNIGMCMFSKIRNSVGLLENPSASYTGTGVILRDAEIGLMYAGSDLVGCDESGLMGGLAGFTNLAGGNYQHTSGDVNLTSTWNGRQVRYSGASDITVTIPRKLPPGFEVEFVATGAGAVSVVGAFGLGVWSNSGTRTVGQYSRVKIRRVSTIGYHVEVTPAVLKVAAATANTTVTLPAGVAIKRIYARNTTANAVTGGVRIGTTNGGSEIIGATALAGNSIAEAAPVASGLSTSSQTLYVQAVTAWGGASVDFSIEVAPVFN